MGVRHFTLRPPGGNVSRMPDSLYSPRRPLPRHSGQSSARDGITTSSASSEEVEAENRISDVSALRRVETRIHDSRSATNRSTRVLSRTNEAVIASKFYDPVVL